MPSINASGFDPANPTSISCDDPDSISFLRMLLTWAEQDWPGFTDKFSGIVSEHDLENIKAGLADPGTCGIVATGAD